MKKNSKQFLNRHLNKRELDDKIIKVQKSTRTTIPFLIPLHEKIRMRFRWYYNWHTFNYSKAVHWVILLIYLSALPFVLWYWPNNQLKTTKADIPYEYPKWETISSPTTKTLTAVDGIDGSNIWAVGSSGTILKYNGTAWSSVTNSGITKDLNDVSAIDANHIWVVGNNGTIKHTNNGGTDWITDTVEIDISNYVLNTITMVSTNNGWIGYYSPSSPSVCLCLFYNGFQWGSRQISSEYYFHINNLSSSSSSNVWGVTLDHILNNKLSSVELNLANVATLPAEYQYPNYWYYSIFTTDANNIYIYAYNDSNSIVIKYDGANWSRIYYNSQGDYPSNIFALNANNIWLSDGSKYDGTNWVKQNYSGNDVYAFDVDHAFSVGGSGKIEKYSSPSYNTAKKFLIVLPGQTFVDGVGVTGTPNPVKAGVPVTATIYAVNWANNLDTRNASWASFTTTDPNDTNPPNTELTKGDTCDQALGTNCGQTSVNFTFYTAGTQTITATDAYGVLSSGTSSNITVTGGTPQSLYYSKTGNGYAGQPISLSVGLKDAFGNTTTAESNLNINLSDNSSTGYFSTDSVNWLQTLTSTIPNGSSTANFYYLNYTKGNYTISAASSGLSPTSFNTSITSGPISSSKSSASISNSSFKVSNTEGVILNVNLKDDSDNVISGRTLSVTSNRNRSPAIDVISPAAAVTDGAGNATFHISSTKIGTATLTIADVGSGIILQNHPQITFWPGDVTALSLSGTGSERIAGTLFNLTLAAYDAFGNIATNYVGTVHFTISDNKVSAPGNYTFSSSDAGVKNFVGLSFKTAGNQKITATDISSGVFGNISVVVKPADPSATSSSISSNKDSIKPDGTDVADITVAITDDFGNPWSGKKIKFNNDRSEDVISYFNTTTDSQGKVYAKLTSSKEGEAKITADDETDHFTLTNSLTIKISAGQLSDIVKKLTPAAAAVAAAGFIPLLINALGAIPFTLQYLIYLFNGILEALGIRRRGQPWGIVFDSVTGKPIDLATVRLFNYDNYKLVTTQVSDLQGRFHFWVEPGRYFVSVIKKGYTFPVKRTTKLSLQKVWKKFPQIAPNLYIGQPVEVKKENQVLNLMVPMDQNNEKPNFWLAARMMSRDLIDWFTFVFGYIFIPLMILGAIFSILSAILLQTKQSYILAGLYILLLIYYYVQRRIKANRVGQVIDAKTQKPIAGAIIYIYDKKYNSLKTAQFSDKFGRFSVLLQPGEYYLTADSKGYNFPSKEIQQSKKSFKKYKNIYQGETIYLNKTSYLDVTILMDGE